MNGVPETMMPPESAGTNDGTTTPPKPDGGAPGTTEDAGETKTVGLDEHIRMRKRAQDAETALAALKAAETEAATKAAETQGEYQTLYGQAKPKADRFDAFVTQVEVRNQTRVAALPEDWKPVVPKGLDALDLGMWLDEMEPKLRDLGTAAKGERPAGARAAGTASGGTPATVIPEQAKVDAANAGKTPEEWWAIMSSSARYKSS